MKIAAKILLFPIIMLRGLWSIYFLTPVSMAERINHFAMNADDRQAFLFQQNFGRHFLQGRLETTASKEEIIVSVPCVGVYAGTKTDLIDFCAKLSLTAKSVPAKEGWEFLELRIVAGTGETNSHILNLLQVLGVPRFSLFRLVFL